MAFRLTSPAFDAGDIIPTEYTCEGSDRSPPLRWDDAPQGTRSFLLTCEDPDAPRGTFCHWAVFDIPPDWAELPEGATEDAVKKGLGEAVNGFGKVGYGGPCPPKGHGTHHYHFRLSALDVARLDLGERPSCSDVAGAAEAHVLASAELIGLFQRPDA